ncbi:hypothetical protein BT69DRAFT_1325874 [Atractiella rhizophila]|nr:hypothetical protein BT69DRAFT_1325874 [Atractiella rhizophila]
MSREDPSFPIHIQIATRRDFSSNPYVQGLESKVFELESSLEKERMDKDKWKKFYMEKDEEVDRLRLELEKVKKVLPPVDSTSKQRVGGIVAKALAPETGSESYGEDWIKRPVKPYRPIISKEDAEDLGIFWERTQAAASTRSGVQNKLLDPVQVLHQLVFDEVDDSVIGATQLSSVVADSIKNQTGLCKTVHLPNILRKLEADYSSVLCLGKNDWMSRIFVTAVLRNTSGSAYKCDGERDEDGGQIVKRGIKRKASINGSVMPTEKRNRVESVNAEHGSGLEGCGSIVTAVRVVERTMKRKNDRPMANLPNDPLHGIRASQNKLLKRQNNSTSVPDTLKGSIGLTIDELKEMVADNNCLINLKVLAAFIEDGILPLCHAHSRAIDSKTLAQSATKRLLITITSAECDINLPIDADEDDYTSEDLRNNPRGDMLGHNSLGEETLFCLRKWKNVGSREAIGELLQAVVRGAKVAQRLCKRWKEAYPDSMDVTPLLLNFSCVGRLAESLAEAWLEGGGSNAISDVRSAKDLKNIMVAGEYSKALLQRSQQHTDPVSTTSKEKNLKAEKHRFPQSPLRSTLHYLRPPSLRINNVVPPPEQGEAFILTLQQGHDVPIPPPTDNHLPPPPPQECGIAPMLPCSKISHFLPPPCSEGPLPGHIAPPSDIRPTPLKLGQVGQANGIGANKKRRGKSKKNEENSDALLPEEVASLREDVEKLRPLLDKQDMMAQLVEAKKMAKENHWNAEHWKKMLQNQVSSPYFLASFSTENRSTTQEL